MLYHDSVVLLFAKAPVEGKVNTRLIADIGVQAATELQDDLIHHRLSMLTKAKLCDVRLLCAPDSQHECFATCERRYPMSLFEQSGIDLGERMYNAIEAALHQYKFCIVIGTDAPALDAINIKQALQALHEGTEVVFVPAEDGGYVLVGAQQAYDFLFQDVSWGSSKVMQQSRDRLDANDVLYKELATCWDVDRLEDYQRYLSMSEITPKP